MNAVSFTAIILTGALISEVHAVNLQPCVQQSDISAYRTFAKRHILSKSFDRNSLQEWESYLRLNGLCGRQPTQSFIDAKAKDVKGICKTLGRLIQDAPQSQGNFCISQSTMRVYDVKSDGRCKITSAKGVDKRVVVRCAKVGKTCLPIHFEAYRNQTPSKTYCS
ncbi:seminal ribonuclease-like [Cheilinus undulatus]|uniref:seminal ribonuclease-like n=1 Tax=Cheilinus undulatus TaxID=241271 RepID=UPI001BD4AE8E|nr:seminal ribonuclease-like [Cheilinus undulatus]